MSYESQIMNLPCKVPEGQKLRLPYQHGHRDARHAGSELGAAADRQIEDLTTKYQGMQEAYKTRVAAHKELAKKHHEAEALLAQQLEALQGGMADIERFGRQLAAREYIISMLYSALAVKNAQDLEAIKVLMATTLDCQPDEIHKTYWREGWYEIDGPLGVSSDKKVDLRQHEFTGPDND